MRRNSEWHHFDPLGTAGVITGSNAGVLSSNLYDVFGVLRYGQGSAQTPWRQEAWRKDDEQMIMLVATGSFGNASYIIPFNGTPTVSGVTPTGIKIYGECCGPFYPPESRRKRDPGGNLLPDPRPVDALDWSCFRHDDCMDMNCKGGGAVGAIACTLCYFSLLRCIDKVDCSQAKNPFACKLIKTTAKTFFYLSGVPLKICYMVATD